jgi:hypothetical protein
VTADLGVVRRQGGVQRDAADIAENIRWNAEQLASTDALVGQRLQTKATELEAIRFEGEGSIAGVQAVDLQTSATTPVPGQ